MHPVLCSLSHQGSDVRCLVCGQGFIVYWASLSRAEQGECRRIVQDQLREHHIAARDPGADRRIHPRAPFNVPDWSAVPHLAPALSPHREPVQQRIREDVFEDVA
jgi:hypothetical protein